MIRKPVFLAAAIACLLAGCGGDSAKTSSGSTSSVATTAQGSGRTTSPETTTPSTTKAQPPKKSPKKEQAPVPDNDTLTKAQLTRTRTTAVGIAVCLRRRGIRAAIGPDLVRSRMLKLARGVTMRVRWDDKNGADLHLAGTTANYRRTADLAPKAAVTRRKQRAIVIYDHKPTADQRAAIRDCLRGA